MLRFSIIVPVFNRPDEVNEFLESISKQEFRDVELIMVDGSPTEILQPVIEKNKDQLPLNYIYVKGLGASESRNLGCEKALGEYLVFIDSDCIVPETYLKKVNEFLLGNKVDGFGGPDCASDSFTPAQKAINYAMTSFFTTGGIRGKKKHIGKFQLRGFNMGVSRESFFAIGGFSGMQVAEDIDLSMRLHKAGFTTALIPDAFVYHKRKTNFKKFHKQLLMHGKGRIDLYLRHKDALKLVHLFPTFFDIYLVITFLTIFIKPEIFICFFSLIVFYFLLLLFHATWLNKKISIGLLSTIASFIMLWAYGNGLFINFIKRIIFKKGSDSKKSVILKN